MKTATGIFLGLLLLFQASVAPAETLTLATGEWVPFTSASLEDYGRFTRIVSIVLDEMEIDPQYRFYPWPRCYDSVVKGRVWGAFPYSRTEERAKQVVFSDPVSCSKTVWFYYEKETSGGGTRYDGVEDLKYFKVGGIFGYFYEETFKEMGLEVDYANNEISALEKLKAGRIDLLPLNDLVGKHLIKVHFPVDGGRFKTLSKPLSVDSLHLIVSRDRHSSIALLERFNAALKRSAEKGLIRIPNCD